MAPRHLRSVVRLAIVAAGTACQSHPQTVPGQALIPACTPGTCTEPFVAADSALPFATLQGLVVDQTDLQGLRGATVRSNVTGHTVHADRDGRFHLEGLKVGPDTLLVTSLGYKPRVVAITVPPMGGLWLFTKLERAPAL